MEWLPFLIAAVLIIWHEVLEHRRTVRRLKAHDERMNQIRDHLNKRYGFPADGDPSGPV